MFGLGEFTHFNNPIFASPEPSSITSARLTVSINATFVDVPLGINEVRNVQSVFDFDHWETPNAANPCADGGTVGVGVNVNGCADRVTPTLNLGLSDKFTVGLTEFVFDVTGFQGIGSAFWTTERLTNSATMNGRFTAVTNVIPLPAPFLLLLGGLAGLGVVSRRRKAA